MKDHAEDSALTQKIEIEQLYAVVPCAIFTVDTRRIITSFNKAAEEITGYHENDVVGKMCTLWALEPCASHCGLFSEEVEKPIRHKICTISAKDGSVITVMKNADLIRDRSGVVVGGVESFFDISAIKRFETELSQEKEKLQKIFEAAPVGMLLINEQIEVVSSNRVISEMVLRDPVDIINKRTGGALGCVNSFENPRGCGFGKACDSCSLRKGVMNVLKSNGVVHGAEVELTLRIDGIDRRCWLSVNSEQVMLDGKIYAVVSLDDVTERKKSEESLRQATVNYEKANRELELQTRRANELAEKADAANRAKGVFLANMSHEIRTPLSGLLGMTALLLDSGLTEEQREYGEAILSTGHTLSSLINDILDFSKIEAEKLTLDTMPFDLRTTIEGAMEINVVKAVEKELDVATFIHASVPMQVRGDPGRLRQIIVNLVGNAIKFTEQGEVGLSVRVVEEDPPFVKVRFEVRDTGIGIPEEVRKNLFTSFFQGDVSITRRYGGTGLGLAISKSLAEIMGGQVGVERPEGGGSLFWFTVRLENISTPESAIPAPAVSVRDKRILIADPAKGSSQALFDYLTAWNCVCVKETDIAKVIDRCIAAARNSKPFDAIIVAAHQDSDSSMQTVRTIRDDPAIRNVRIILVTDLGRRGDAAKMKAAGVDGYLTKPVKLAVLAECLGMIFSRAGAPRIETSRDRELITIHDVAESKNKNKVKILLVEDNLINQKVATKMLQKAGYSCDIASNGKEAVEAFALTGYSVILMDCQMPVLSGYDATRAIRDREKEGGTVNHVPIIAMTANTMKGDEEECIACGMDDFISKPFSLAVLVDKIQKWAGSSDL